MHDAVSRCLTTIAPQKADDGLSIALLNARFRDHAVSGPLVMAAFTAS